MAGASPATASDVNQLIGAHLRAFTETKEIIGHDRDWLATADLQADPYLMTPADEVLIKSAIADLDTALDAVDMTFINRLTGLF